MDLLLILTYTGLCVVVFKVFRIPLNKWTVPTAILGGVVIIGALLMVPCVGLALHTMRRPAPAEVT